MRIRWIRSVFAVSLAAGATIATGAPAFATSDSLPAYRHVFYIVEENRSLSQIIGNPDAPTFNQLATQYSLATSYFRHQPSE
jgi:hypothetical protein